MRHGWLLLVLTFAMLTAPTACRIEHRNTPTSATAASDSSDVFQGESEASDSDTPVLPDPGDQRPLAQKIRDASIEAQVKLALADVKELRLLDLENEVQAGVVTLRGEVPSSSHYQLAESAARGVNGVRGIRNDLIAPNLPLAVIEETVDSAKAEVPVDEASDADSQTVESALQGDTQDEAQTAAYHTVESGESLWVIARNNGTSVDTIKRLNNLSSDRVRPGQRLRIR